MRYILITVAMLAGIAAGIGIYRTTPEEPEVIYSWRNPKLYADSLENEGWHVSACTTQTGDNTYYVSYSFTHYINDTTAWSWSDGYEYKVFYATLPFGSMYFDSLRDAWNIDTMRADSLCGTRNLNPDTIDDTLHFDAGDSIRRPESMWDWGIVE